jgi:multiple sugar transport system ATP-binding protein
MTLGDRVAVLKRGILQQLASPRELYEQPVNLFVAGFIGSPPMNFLPATVRGDQVELPFVTVELPEHAKGRVPEDKLLIAGIRPEYFEDKTVVEEHKLDHGATFTATVDVVEWLGNEAYAYIPYEAPPEVAEQLSQLEKDLDSEALRTQLIVSLGSASRVRGGEEAELFVDARKMHLFDPASGDNLTVAPTEAVAPVDAPATT